MALLLFVHHVPSPPKLCHLESSRAAVELQEINSKIISTNQEYWGDSTYVPRYLAQRLPNKLISHAESEHRTTARKRIIRLLEEEKKSATAENKSSSRERKREGRR